MLSGEQINYSTNDNLNKDVTIKAYNYRIHCWKSAVGVKLCKLKRTECNYKWPPTSRWNSSFYVSYFILLRITMQSGLK